MSSDAVARAHEVSVGGRARVPDAWMLVTLRPEPCGCATRRYLPLKNPSLANSSPVVRMEPLFRRQGLTWLQQQLGNPYGKEDIVDQVLRIMGLKMYVGEPKNYDCSDLAADFMVHGGAGKLLGKFEDNLHLISPNDLARVLGVK